MTLYNFIFSVIMTVGLFSVIRFMKHRSPNVVLKDVKLKAIASICFVAAISFVTVYSLSCLPMKSSGYVNDLRALILLSMGALLTFVGDILLDFKCIYLKDSDFFLKFGFISFIFAHLLYIISFVSLGNLYDNKITILILICVSIIIGFISVLLEKSMQVIYGKFKFIVAAYSGIIFLSLNVSILNIISNGVSLKNVLITMGVFSIILSDGVLNQTYFGEGKNTKGHIVANHTLYYLGQYMIALSAFLILK